MRFHPGNPRITNAKTVPRKLATLTSFYRVAPEYINAITASLFNWHRSRVEPNGPGTAGTVIGPLAGGCVINGLERMVVELVAPLSEFDFSQWREQWDAAGSGGTRELIA